METIKNLAAHLDDKIKLRGIWEMIDGVVLEKGLEQGYQALHRFNPDLAEEFLQLAEAYMKADREGMVDEAADLGAAVLKLIIFKRK